MSAASWIVHEGDALAVLRTLPSESVQCCVTSPPYWGLRDYGVAGQIGLEETPEAWLARLVEVFAEVRRVLRSDGTLWINVGDSHASGGGSGAQGASGQVAGRAACGQREAVARRTSGRKPKDLVGQPWMLAFALRDEVGYFLRAEVIWHKRSVMPESVMDRPTRAHEQVFLLAKGARYYYDAEAIREMASENTHGRGAGDNPKRAGAYELGCRANESFLANGLVSSRNKRSVWTLGPEPCSAAHFGTFPTALVMPCLLAGTSEKGACPVCVAPWRRIVEASGGCLGASWHDHAADATEGAGQALADGSQPRAALYHTYSRETKGWEPSCDCALTTPAAPVPCIVLDPFVGSGTTGIVARRLGRAFLGIELNPEYVAMARRRIDNALNQEARPAVDVPGQGELFPAMAP